MNNSEVSALKVGGTTAKEVRKGSRLVLAPNGDQLWYKANTVPSLDLRFAENKNLVDATTGQNLVTFTRASNGTYVDSQGVIRTATTNLLLRSEEFDNASWIVVGTAGVTANADTAPNGATSAERITFAAASYIRQFVGTVIPGATYTVSLWVKKPATGGASAIRIASNNVNAWNTGFSQKFTLTSQWQRITATGTLVSSNTSAYVIFGTKTEADANDADCVGDVLVWGAQLEQSSTVGEYIPTTSTINSAPRFDHNPTTGESLGLLVEEQRTNSIRNNTMVGAVAGTPGTLPANWALSGLGTLTQQVIGIGTVAGINYIDLRFSGTTSTTQLNIRLEQPNGATGANGQIFSCSLWLARIAGSLTNISGIGLNANLYDSTPNYLSAPGFSGFDLTNQPTTFIRRGGTLTIASANAAFIQPQISVTFLSGVAIDITLRIGLPQLEQGAFATSVIPTTTAAATRSADVASITGSAFASWYRQDEGTVFAEGSSANLTASTFPVFADFSVDVNNRLRLSYITATQGGGIVNSGGVTSAQGYPSVTVNPRKGAFNWSSSGSYSVVFNSGAATTFAGAYPVGTFNQLTIGNSVLQNTSNNLNGTIRRLTYWPRRLPNETLQGITQ